MKPTIGEVVHYVSFGTPVREDGTQAFPRKCRAAIVTEVIPEDNRQVGLMVANPTGFFFHPLADGGCYYDDSADAEGGTWHWLERVED